MEFLVPIYDIGDFDSSNNFNQGICFPFLGASGYLARAFQGINGRWLIES
jgi:hypothetical protein